MLDAAIKTQLGSYLEHLQHPIELVASLDDGDKSRELRAMLEDIAELSDKVRIRVDGQDARRPSFSVGRPG
ncbi:MAG: alkyl hydroperoxide reductase subunit F, partial [Candidatus Accumulibacter sp.]|nr:alkyl hydroperoxide reductase subunit F [Accumulibacter sp.]